MTGPTRIELGPGSGVVAARGGVALFAADDGAVEPVLAVVRETISAFRFPLGRPLARRLAVLLTSDEAEHVVSFGVLAEAGDGLLVFLSGDVTARADRPDGTVVEFDGRSSATWVDRILPTGTSRVSISPIGTEAPEGSAPTAFELTAGVVPGGWLRLVAATDPAVHESPPPPRHAADDAEDASTAEMPSLSPPIPLAPPSPEARSSQPVGVLTGATDGEELPAPFVSFVLTPDRSSLREALPIESAADDTAADASAAGARDVVAGILCSRQHFNSPDAGYCSSCGISMVHQTHNLVQQLRPPLGFLVFDDGSTFTLDGRYVIGREPDLDPLVGAGEARPLLLDDPQMSVSRVHAEIRLVEWDVEVIDRGSTNGTHLWDSVTDGWVRLTAGDPRPIPPGTRGAIGQRTFVYESPHHR